MKPRDVTKKTWQPREQQFEIESKWGISVRLTCGGDDVDITILSEFGQATLGVPKDIMAGMCDWFQGIDTPEFWASKNLDTSESKGFGKNCGKYGSEWQIDASYACYQEGDNLGVCDVRVQESSVSIHYTSESGNPAFFVFTVEDFRSIVKWYNSEME